MKPASLSSQVDHPELYTVAEVCQLLRISRWSFYRLIHTRRLRSITIGRSRRVTRRALTSYLDQLDHTGDFQ